MTRRELILTALAARALSGQGLVEELLNASEFEVAARQKLAPDLFALIAGGDRRAYDRITFRPRLMIDTTKLDLTTDFLGQKMYAPILIGPVMGLERFRPGGDAEMAKGAAGAKATFIQSDSPGWISLGSQAMWDWKKIDDYRKTAKTPVVLKGVMQPDEARAAIDHGIGAIVVSNYAATSDSGLASPIEVLPKIAAAVNGKIPILIDGGIRRGSDVLKAIALGARAVLIARPAVWALSTYGAAGVQTLLALLQNELARDMAMCGKATITSVDSSIVKIHV